MSPIPPVPHTSRDHRFGAGRGLRRWALPLILTSTVCHADGRIPERVRDHGAARVERGHCVGLVIGVVDETGTSYFSRGRMSADAGPVTEETIFEIGSITKVFTATLLADMHVRGLVALEDPVARLLPPDVRVPTRGGKSITLLDLATHRSGLPRLPDGFAPDDVENPYADYSGDDLLRFLAAHELSRDPGATYEYSNLGAGLLGYALARRAGTSYERLVIERISAPLGMADTRITLTPGQRSRLAQGHSGRKAVQGWDFDALAGAGALRSTARDMVRFLRANLGFVDGPPSRAMKVAHQSRFVTGERDLSIALGWHVWTRHGTTILWHNGGTAGYRSFCGFSPGKKRGVIVLTNSHEVIDDIGLHLLEPKFALSEVRAMAPVESAALQELAGYYELRPGAVFHITHEGGQLFAQLTGQERLPVYPESPLEFYYKAVDARLSFVRGPDQKVVRLVLHQNGDHEARRLSDYTPPAHIEVAVDARILARYAGKYQLAPGVLFDVIVDGGQLRIKLGDQPRLPVFPESETRFFYKAVEAQITFVQDDAGRVTSLVLHQGGIDQTAKKVE